jgi:ankyrin repeat protein
MLPTALYSTRFLMQLLYSVATSKTNTKGNRFNRWTLFNLHDRIISNYFITYWLVLMKINYWKGARGSETLLQTHKDTITNILNGDFTGGQLEKLRGFSDPIVYSFRMNQADRLLFTTHHEHLLVLDYIENHDYQKSSFLKRGVLKRHLSTLEEIDYFAPLDETEALPPFSHEEGESVGLDYYNHQFIQLGTEQEDILNTTRLPLILNGAPGSGKTYLSLSFLEKKCRELGDDARLLYVSKNPLLVDAMQKIWNNDFAYSEQKDNVRFAHYSELMFPAVSSFSEARDCHEWLGTLKKNANTTNLTAEQIYHEFRICSAFTLEQYLRLGRRQTNLHDAGQKTAVYRSYERYVCYLNQSSRIDPALMQPATFENAVYDFIAVDESQNFSLKQLIHLVQLATNAAIVLNMDSHQNLMDSCPVRVLLPVYFHPMTFETQSLQKNYRYSQYISSMLQEILVLKRTVFDGKLDKEETICLRSQNDVFRGEVYLLNPDEYSNSMFETINDRTQSTEFAVVTQEHYIAEAKAFWDTPLIFTPEQIQGQEFHTIVVYKCLPPETNKKLWKEIYSRFDSIDADDVTNNRTKNRQVNQTHLTWINTYFTASSRAIHSLIIIEETPQKANSGYAIFLNRLKKYAHNEITPERFHLNQNWREMAEHQRSLHHDSVAIEIEEKLGDDKAILNTTTLSVTDKSSYHQKKPSSSVIPNVSKKQPKDIEKQPKDMQKLSETLITLFSAPTSQENDEKIRNIIGHEEFDCNLNASYRNKAVSFGYVLMHKAIQKEHFNWFLLLLEKSNKTPMNQHQKQKEISRLFLQEKLIARPDVCAQVLITNQFDINYYDREEHHPTILDFAVSNNALETVALLLRQDNIDINKLSLPDENVPLLTAIYLGHEAIVDRLLEEKKTEVNIAGKQSITPLIAAVQHGAINIVKLLLRRSDININKKLAGVTPLLIAIRLQHTDIARDLINCDAVDLNAQAPDKATALLMASQYGMVDIVQLLLDKKDAIADINHCDRNGYTAVMHAIKSNHLEIVRLLVVATGIKLHAQKARHDSPIAVAVEHNRLEILTFLLTYQDKFDINALSLSGFTALSDALFRKHFDIAKLLLSQENIDLQRCDYETKMIPLMFAATIQNLDLIKEIFYRNPRLLNYRDSAKQSTILLSTYLGHLEAVEFLLAQEGIDISGTIPITKETILIKAISHGWASVVTLLLTDKSLDVTATDYKKESALDLALSYPCPISKNKILESLFTREDILKEYLRKHVVPSYGNCFESNPILIVFLKKYADQILSILKSSQILKLSRHDHLTFLQKLLDNLNNPSNSMRRLWTTSGSNNSTMFPPTTNLSRVVLELEELIQLLNKSDNKKQNTTKIRK